jgi:hypothetical protein
MNLQLTPLIRCAQGGAPRGPVLGGVSVLQHASADYEKRYDHMGLVGDDGETTRKALP